MKDRNGKPASIGPSVRGPGAILLVSCYELGHQPLGLASPLSFLERAGYAPATLDISVEALDEEKVGRARLVGVSVPMHTALRLGVRVAERVREINPECYICFYGLYALLNADFLLSRVADYAIGGEFEQPLVALVQALESGSAAEVEGVVMTGRPASPVLKRLSFPVPSRHQLPALEKYARLERHGRHELVGYVEASHGCLHFCLHCPIPPIYGGRFFVVPRDVVLQDIGRLVGLGARHISFGDADFLNGPGHSLGIVRAMREEFPDLTFDFTAKIEHLLKRRAILPELGKLGCLFVVSAVESLSDTVLANLEKGHTRVDIFEALIVVREAGIALRPSFVSFTPWTTLHDYLDVLDFVESESLIDHVDPVQYTIRLLIPPGSSLLERDAIRPYLGPLAQESFSYQWTHPDARMDELYRAVSGLVQEAAEGGEDPVISFQRVRATAYQLHGERPIAPKSIQAPPIEDRSPRLTEPWFC